MRADCFCLLVAALAAGTLHGEVKMNPAFVSAARLVDSSGKPLAAGEQPCHAEIWNAATGGTKYWAADLKGTVVGTNGAFSVTVGDGDERLRSALVSIGSAGKDAYLQLSVTLGGKTIALPVRQKLGKAATATVAGSVERVSGEFLAQGDVELNGAVSVTGGADFGKETLVGDRLTVGGAVVVSNGTAVVLGSMAVGDTLTVRKPLTMASAQEGVTNEFHEAEIQGTLTAGSLAVKGTAKYGAADIAFPAGAIVMWNDRQGNIPKDWALCDGQTHDGVATPDLRGYFVRGGKKGESNLGASTYGADKVSLSSDQIPSHQHKIKGDNFKGFGYSASTTCDRDPNYLVTEGSRDSKESKSAGKGTAHENRPPYYALYYIMKVK